MTKFKRVYLQEDERNKNRDRFQVEFSPQERAEFSELQLLIEQAKDATAIKQLAWLGGLAISNHNQFLVEFRNTLLKNERNNKRVGVNPKLEVMRKIPSEWAGK